MLTVPILIRDLALPNRVVLAPLAGVSDVPFRRICAEMGAALTYVEMLASNAILRGNRRTLRMWARHGSEARLGVQLTGPTPEEIAEAVRVLDGEGFDLIDINMGCPVRKIVRKGWGSAMLQDPERVSRTVRAARLATSRPLSVKIRLGYTRSAINVEEIAARVAGEGADMLVIHGRTRADRYDVAVDYPGIARGIAAARSVAGPSFRACGNGDVLNRTAAARMLAETGCDLVMVSRGALGNPWIFPMVLDPAKPEPDTAEWLETALRHLDYHQAFYGDDPRAAVLARKHLLWYAIGFPGMRRFRSVLSTVSTLDDARRLLRDYVAQLPRGTRRHEPGLADVAPPDFEPKYDMDREEDRAAAEDGLQAACEPAGREPTWSND